MAEGFAGGEEPGGGGDGVEAAHWRAEASTNIEVSGGFDRLGGVERKFGAEDALDAAAGVASVQALAEKPGKGAGVGIEQIGHDKAGGVQFAGGAHAADDGGNLGGLCREEQLGLGEEGVDGIDEDIAGAVGEECWGGFGIEKERERGDGGLGIDVAEPTGSRIDFGQADGGVEGKGVAVEIGGPDFIEVHEGEVADTRPGQGFGGGGTDGTQAGDDDMGLLEAREGVLTEKELQACEGCRHGGSVSNLELRIKN